MIRFGYCEMHCAFAINHGSDTLVIVGSDMSRKPIAKILGALESRSQFVPQPIEHVTELEVNRIAVIDEDVIQGYLSEIYAPIWDRGPLLMAPGDEVIGNPGWYETEGLDQLFPLLIEILTALKYAHPWRVYENYVDNDTIQWAEKGMLDIIKIERLFPSLSIYYPTTSLLEQLKQ